MAVSLYESILRFCSNIHWCFKIFGGCSKFVLQIWWWFVFYLFNFSLFLLQKATLFQGMTRHAEAGSPDSLSVPLIFFVFVVRSWSVFWFVISTISFYMNCNISQEDKTYCRNQAQFAQPKYFQNDRHKLDQIVNKHWIMSLIMAIYRRNAQDVLCLNFFISIRSAHWSTVSGVVHSFTCHLQYARICSKNQSFNLCLYVEWQCRYTNRIRVYGPWDETAKLARAIPRASKRTK